MNSCSAYSGIFLLLTTAIVGCLLFYPVGYIFITYENLYGEWLQFAAFTAIAVFSFLIVRKKLTEKRWFWVLLGLAAFYTAMEEISWGQQIFGWDSWGVFEKNNLQGETNLHNFFTGPYSTLLKDILTYALSIGMLAYGVIYPILLKQEIQIAQRVERLGVVNPGICLIPFFVVAAVCEMSFVHFNEAELAELFVALAMCFVAVRIYYSGGQELANQKLLASKSIVVFLLCLLASVILTQISLHSESSKRRVENRIEAGLKKFGGRYARVGAYDHAVSLYQQHLAHKPQSRSRMRRLARTYKRAGRIDEQKKLLEKSLQLDLEQLEKDAWRASLHRSLFRTYKELGQLDDAESHIEQALTINQQRILDHPESAAAAYSMARTLELLGRKKEATEQYTRAFELKPTSSTYRRAYRDAID